MRNKIFKYVSVLVAVIIAVSLFSVNASAETIETIYTDFWTLDKTDSKVWILDTENNGALTDITDSVKFSTLSSGKIMGVEFKANQNWGAKNILYFNFVFDMRTQYANPGVSSLKFTLYQWNGGRILFSGTDPNVNTGVAYVPWSYRDGNYHIDGVQRRDYQETYSAPNAAKNAVTYQFNNQNAEYGFNRVCVFAYCTLEKPLADSSYKVYFEFAGLDYRYSTMGEYLNMQIVENQNYNTDKIIDNADKNAAEIQQNQDENTDKILNGDSDLDSSGETDKVNGAVGDVDGATDEALGGKSEAEIEAEVSGALDPKQLGNIDVTKAKRMSTFYDRCLKSFGTDYNSLLLLSLILGLAAFLIGRRYG